jgi:hypothetical protein
MSNGFIFGTGPLKFTTPVTVPDVAASTEIVAGLTAEEAEDGSEAGCDLLQPARAMNMTRNRNPKPLKHGGNEEAEEICLIFDVVIYEFFTFINLPFGDFLNLRQSVR